jgi:hypothetical protein
VDSSKLHVQALNAISRPADKVRGNTKESGLRWLANPDNCISKRNVDCVLIFTYWADAPRVCASVSFRTCHV